MSNIPEEILQAVKEKAEDGKISCPKARKIAEDFNVSVKLVGDACNQLRIKIFACELGCF